MNRSPRSYRVTFGSTDPEVDGITVVIGGNTRRSVERIAWGYRFPNELRAKGLIPADVNIHQSPEFTKYRRHAWIDKIEFVKGGDDANAG